MKIATRAEILKASVYSDIFSSDPKEAKRQLHSYVKMYHPDCDPSAGATKVFDIVTKLYNSRSDKKAKYETDNGEYTFKDRATGKGFIITNPIVINNGTCTVYHTATKIVLEYSADFEKFYKKYNQNVKLIRYADSNMQEKFERCFPKVLKHFESDTGSFVILLDKTPEILNLGLVLDSYKASNVQFPDRQAAWIMNRLFNFAQYMKFSGKVFNGFSLYNLWVSPEFHSVLLLNGWEYSTRINDKMIGCPKDVFNILPVRVKDKHLSVTETDLESIKYIGRKLFNGSSAENTLKYLDTGTDTDDPIVEWQKYGNAIKADFGKRKFVAWENPLYNIKKA